MITQTLLKRITFKISVLWNPQTGRHFICNNTYFNSGKKKGNLTTKRRMWEEAIAHVPCEKGHSLPFCSAPGQLQTCCVWYSQCHSTCRQDFRLALPRHTFRHSRAMPAISLPHQPPAWQRSPLWLPLGAFQELFISLEFETYLRWTRSQHIKCSFHPLGREKIKPKYPCFGPSIDNRTGWGGLTAA